MVVWKAEEFNDVLDFNVKLSGKVTGKGIFLKNFMNFLNIAHCCLMA